MEKCKLAKKGDKCFGYEFKNKAMLKTHLEHKHKETKVAEPSQEKEETDELSEADLFGETKTEKQETGKEPIGMCSECGADVFEGQSACSNCKESFN